MITKKEAAKAEMICEQFMDLLGGEEIGVCGLSVLMILGTFIVTVSDSKAEALNGLDNITRDLIEVIEKSFDGDPSQIN
jgi:hypothetical protein